MRCQILRGICDILIEDLWNTKHALETIVRGGNFIKSVLELLNYGKKSHAQLILSISEIMKFTVTMWSFLLSYNKLKNKPLRNHKRTAWSYGNKPTSPPSGTWIQMLCGRQKPPQGVKIPASRPPSPTGNPNAVFRHDASARPVSTLPQKDHRRVSCIIFLSLAH